MTRQSDEEKGDFGNLNEDMFNVHESDIDNFLENPVWLTMEQWLTDRIDIMNEEIIEVDEVPRMKMIQGEMRHARTVLAFPGLLRDEIIQDVKEAQRLAEEKKDKKEK